MAGKVDKRWGANSKRHLNGLPKRGSKTRAILALMLRPQGLTVHEAVQLGLSPKSGNLGGPLQQLELFKGWDIRRVSLPEEHRKERNNRWGIAYKVVGRYRDSGRYRSFVSADYDR